ncbi:MAG: hypothetical protein P1Q69_13415 [Candidatus Thorarchaeota archaeon]|nr:hypothetical protein [Candidatus Thorarchaeota archaeon]
MIQLELNIAVLATGSVILAYTIWRSRRIADYKRTMMTITEEYDVQTLDFSGETKYTRCKSHEWIMDNMMRKKHGRLGTWFQEHLHDNTLAAALWVGFVIGMAAIILGLVAIRSIEIAGMSIVVFGVGALVLLGPGGPKVSEDFLQAIEKYPLADLCDEDFVYVKISYDSIKNWLITSGIIGVSIIAISPWAEMIPIGLAVAIAVFSEVVLWGPALVLMEIWFPLAIMYLGAVVPILVLLSMTITRRIRGRTDERESSAYQW